MNGAAPELGGDPPGLAELLEFVSSRTGLVFPPARRASVEAALQRALRRDGVEDARSLLERARTDLSVLDELLADLTIGETYFFREPAQFEFITRDVVPALLVGRSDRTLRAWSAACASGEEPYSLAITLREAGAGARHVIGTDVSRHRLSAAQRGVYREWSFRGVAPDRLARHFTRRGAAYRLNDRERDGVEFRYLNLAEDVFPSIASGIWGMDLVLCRNVLIYFDVATIRRVAARLLDSLSDDGWLFLGASDPILSDFLSCEVELTGAGVAYRRPGRVDRPASPERVVPPPRAQPEPDPVVAQAPPLAASARVEPGPVRPEDATAAARESVVTPEFTLAYAARDYAAAAAAARARIGEGAAGVDAWIVLARSLANEGKLAEAGAACASGLDRHGTSAELMYLHAVLLGEGSRARECADAARRALYLDPTLIVARLLLGGALARLGEREAATRALGAAERELARLPAEAVVPASDGEPAGRLRQMARAQLALAEAGAA